MTRLPHFWRAFAVGFAAAATTVSMTQVASAGPNPPPPPAPPSPPAGNQVFLVGHTKPGSVQIYTCSATGSSFTWTVAPDAILLGDNGQQIATHFAGPTWQATDGSKFVGKLPPLGTAPSANSNSIPQLLLTGTATPVGADGGRLGATTYIQRANTNGGVGPAASTCTQAAVGTVTKVEYSADYYFWKATGKPPKPTA